MKKILKFSPVLSLGYLLLPLVASAQNPGQVNSILNNFRSQAGLIITILFIVATLVFLWGVIKFIAQGDNEAERKKARGIMTWGIIGLAVMGFAWGLTRFLGNYFGVQGQNIPTLTQ